MAKAVGPVALVLGVLHVACGNRREAVCRARCVPDRAVAAGA
jgi:hypothetical protein